MIVYTEDVLQSLMSSFQSKPVTGLTGAISVKTESWNSKDGLIVRSHKTQAIGGRWFMIHFDLTNQFYRRGHNSYRGRGPWPHLTTASVRVRGGGCKEMN